MTAMAPAAAIPTFRALRRPFAKVAIVVAVTTLPLLRPAGPGNTGLADVGVVGAMLVAALWVSGRGQRVRVPFAVPVAMTVAAGALSGLVGGGDLLTLFQDVFVFGWAIAIANLARDPQLLDVFAKAWAYSATVWGGALIFGVVAGLPWLAGVTARDGIRASFTLGDPNLAANYFLCCLLVMRAAQRPRHRGWRFLACAVVLTALILTLSNGGFLALVLATGLGWLFKVAQRRGLAPAIAASCVVGLLSGWLISTINLNDVADQARQSAPLLRDSIGRQGESGGSRSTLAREELKLWIHGDTLIGLGPAQTEPTLRHHLSPYVKEAHDDYMASLVERGVLGASAIIVLGTGLAIRSRRIARRGALPPAYAGVIPRPELLGALAIALALSAALYEVLHFRHVWAVFGLIAALDYAVRGARDGAVTDRVAVPAGSER